MMSRRRNDAREGRIIEARLSPAHGRRPGRAGLGRALYSIVLLVSCAACAGKAPSIVEGPLVAPSVPRPAYVERTNNGAIFQPSMHSASLFSDARKPSNVGDTLKVDISESLKASNAVDTDTSRENKLASKGPGSSAGGLLGNILNLDAAASGSDSYKGNGNTSNTATFTGQLTASVIAVHPNGNLLVAGERSTSLNGNISTLRFSGIVNPKDIKPGNIVASSDAANARLEVAGKGDVSTAGSRTWIQRVLANSLAIW